MLSHHSALSTRHSLIIIPDLPPKPAESVDQIEHQTGDQRDDYCERKRLVVAAGLNSVVNRHRSSCVFRNVSGDHDRHSEVSEGACECQRRRRKYAARSERQSHAKENKSTTLGPKFERLPRVQYPHLRRPLETLVTNGSA